MRYETPKELLTRLKLGREEAMQRLLTCLILDGPYPRWNTRNRPAPGGIRWLRDLYELSFGDGWPGDEVTFVDEFELRGRTDDERGGAPDYVVLWPCRVWIIELKTEAASHRAAQLPLYFELAHHYFPHAAIDLTYLTPPINKPAPECEAWARYAHVTWQQVASLIRATWADPLPAGKAEIVERLCSSIDMLHLTPTDWRQQLTSSQSSETEQSALAAGLATAQQTANDRVQRAVDVRFASLDELLEYRVELRDAIRAHPSPIQQIRPWVWRADSSGGTPLSEQGASAGYEVRLSRYTSTT